MITCSSGFNIGTTQSNIKFDHFEYNSGDFEIAQNNNIKFNVAGKYIILADIMFGDPGASQEEIIRVKNAQNVMISSSVGNATSTNTVSVSTFFEANKNDTLYFTGQTTVRQTSINTTFNQTKLIIYRVS